MEKISGNNNEKKRKRPPSSLQRLADILDRDENNKTGLESTINLSKVFYCRYF
jgi:hypothetical protein